MVQRWSDGSEPETYDDAGHAAPRGNPNGTPRRVVGNAPIMHLRTPPRSPLQPMIRVPPSLLVAGSLLFLVSCTPNARAPSAGMFIEEFEGFPIYHGHPGRPYRVLGPVFSAQAAARGTAPMKRAAVMTARRLGADAILLNGLEGTQEDDVPALRPDVTDPGSALAPPGKWIRAVAIAILD